jgi:hypothetical protein
MQRTQKGGHSGDALIARDDNCIRAQPRKKLLIVPTSRQLRCYFVILHRVRRQPSLPRGRAYALSDMYQPIYVRNV